MEKANIHGEKSLEASTYTMSDSILKSDKMGEFEIKSEIGWPITKTKQDYHEQRLGQSKWAFRLSFWGSIAGFLLIVIGIVVGIKSNNMEWPEIISGISLEAVSALFYKMSNKANEKISEFFMELTKDENIENAISLSNEIQDVKMKDELKVKLSLHLSGIDEERICKYTKEICLNEKEQ